MGIYLGDTPLVTSGGGGGSTSDFINWLKAQPGSLYSTTKKCMHNGWTTPGPGYIYLFDPYRCTDVLTLNGQIVAGNNSYSSNVLITFNCGDVFCATCECDCISIYYKC